MGTGSGEGERSGLVGWLKGRICGSWTKPAALRYRNHKNTTNLHDKIWVCQRGGAASNENLWPQEMGGGTWCDHPKRRVGRSMTIKGGPRESKGGDFPVQRSTGGRRNNRRQLVMETGAVHSASSELPEKKRDPDTLRFGCALE